MEDGCSSDARILSHHCVNASFWLLNTSRDDLKAALKALVDEDVGSCLKALNLTIEFENYLDNALHVLSSYWFKI